MALTDLRTIIKDPSLVLPIGDTTYEVPPCSADEWIRMQAHQRRIETGLKAGASIEDLGREDDTTGIDLYREALGPAYQQMLDGKVTLSELTVAGMTAYLWQLGNADAAELFWQTGGKALAPPETAPEAPAKKTPSGRTGAAATSTSRPARGSGTRNHAAKRAPSKTASPTRSRKSSQTAN
jgi:hypothetical protein